MPRGLGEQGSESARAEQQGRRVESADVLAVGDAVARKTDPDFIRWIRRERFPHPRTRNKVKFVSLPPREQSLIRQRWMQRKQQAEARRKSQAPKDESPTKDEGTQEEPSQPQPEKPPAPGVGGRSESELAAAREKFLHTPPDKRPSQWVKVDKGNSLWGSAQIGEHADVRDSRLSGKVDGAARVTRSEVGPGARVDGGAVVERSKIDEDSEVGGAAKVTRSVVSGRSRVRGDSEINNAQIRGGSWDGQRIKDGRGGVFHQAWDQETLDILTKIQPKSRMFGQRAPEGATGPGDGPLMSMVRYLEDGGRTKGWLGGEMDRKKLQKRIQKHVYSRHDKRDPWLGEGASYIDDLSDDDFDKLMGVARQEADRRKSEAERRKKAMLYHLAKMALENPDVRGALMPLVRLARDARTASTDFDARRVAIRFAYECQDSRVRTAVVRAVAAADRGPSQEVPAEKRLDLMPDQYRALVRLAFTTTSVSRRRHVLAMLRQAKYSPGFLKWVEKQTFKHPETGNDVKFVSLPPAERSKIHDQWAAGKKEWAQKFKPPGLSAETKLTPKKFDELKEGDVLWISWTPRMLHRVTGFEKTKTGKPVLEMALVDPKTGKDVETRYLHRSSTEKEDYEIHVVPPKGSEKKEPEKKEPEKKEPEKKEPSDGLPDAVSAWNEIKKDTLFQKLVPGAEITDEASSDYGRGDKLKVTSEVSGMTTEMTVLGNLLVKGNDDTKYVVALGKHGPTLLPVSGPKATVKIEVSGKPAKKSLAQMFKDDPGPSVTFKEMKESGLLEALVGAGAKVTQEASDYARGDEVHVKAEAGGHTGEHEADFIVLGKFTIEGKDGSKYVLALSEEGPTVVPVSGPKAKGIKIKKRAPEEKAPEKITEQPPGLPKLAPEALAELEEDFARMFNEWEGSASNFKHLKALGEKYYGDKFDQDAHKAMLRWLAKAFEDTAKELRLEDAEEDADLWQNMAEEVKAKAKSLRKPKKEEPPKKAKPPEDGAGTGSEPKTEGHKPSGKHKDRKELLGLPTKKGGPDTKLKLPKSVVDLGAPEGMSAEDRKEAVARMEALTLDGAKKLLSHLKAAIGDPDGLHVEGLKMLGYTLDGIKKLHDALRARLRPYESRKYTHPVLEMANKYDLEAEDADELYDFRSDKPGYGRKMSDAELFQKFLAKAKPETRERMQGMSLADFMVMYKSIMDEDDEEADLAAA